MKLKLTLALLYLSPLLFSQHFEGYLIYQNRCKSSDPNWQPHYCDLITDSLQVYYFKEGDYKYDVANAEKWTLFKKNENKIYNKPQKKEVVYWHYTAVVSDYDDEILAFKINRKVTKILDYDCDELIVTTRYSIQKYYFNSVTAINPEWFKNHQKGNFDTIFSITQSIPLKTIFIIEQQGLELESVALELKKTTLDPALFAVPNNREMIEAN
jgi:hypothetical protein